MTRRRKAKISAASKPETTRKSVGLVPSQVVRKEVSKVTDTTPILRKQRATRSGLRSRPSTDSQAQTIEVDPEALLRKARKAQKEGKVAAAAAAAAAAVEVQEVLEEPYTQDQIEEIIESIEDPFAGVPPRVDDYDTDNDVSEEEDDQQEFNRSWGYLPPLEDEAVAIIEAIIANPEMAKDYSRTHPNHHDFPGGLRRRNVFLDESEYPDPYADEIRLLPSPSPIEETKAELELHGQLWTLDQAKINQGSNEALFQRTIMMDLIGRQLFIYPRDGKEKQCLDFSVEELWSCPPMPTRAYTQGVKFLSQPKPDLAVSFRRKAVIPDRLWNSIPPATQGLACYENLDLIGGNRIFHFLTIEAKKEKVSIDDNVGRLQSLNNASQALHNMFEFFRDAGYEDTFFAKVRFFSVVSSTEGLRIRIHRATREPEDVSNQGFIMPNRKDYPLRFEYRIFADITKAEFVRPTVLKTFENILLGYGVGILRDLIYNAAQAIVEKVENNLEASIERGDANFYRYGQTIINIKSRLTPVMGMMRSDTMTPMDTTRSPTMTSTQTQLPWPNQTTKGKKRPKSPSQDTMPPPRKRTNQRSFSSNASVEGLC